MPAPAPVPSSRLRAALRLSPGEAARAVEAAVLFQACALALRLVPIRRLQRFLGTPGPREAAADLARADLPDRPRVRAVRRALRRAARAHPDTCLAQALAGRLMLRRRGLPTTLSLGARQTPDGLAFHAWLRSDGVRVNDGGRPDQFAVLSTFYSPPPAAPPPGAPPA